MYIRGVVRELKSLAEEHIAGRAIEVGDESRGFGHVFYVRRVVCCSQKRQTHRMLRSWRARRFGKEGK